MQELDYTWRKESIFCNFPEIYFFPTNTMKLPFHVDGTIHFYVELVHFFYNHRLIEQVIFIMMYNILLTCKFYELVSSMKVL